MFIFIFIEYILVNCKKSLYRGDFMNVLHRWINNFFSVNSISTNTKNLFKFLLKTFFIINFTFSFIILSVNFTLLFKPLYYMDMKVLNIEKSSSLSENEIKANYDYLITYLTQNNKEEFNLPTLPSSSNGKIHFKEVKLVFHKLNVMLLFSILISIIGIIISKRYKKVDYLITSSIVLLIIPIMLLIPFLLNFDKSFTAFHHIFFRNDYWLFDIKYDPIINILPQAFFFHAAILIITLITINSIILWYLYKITSKK
jgi:integral membrane protein (TIGR01906 family)